MPKFNQKGFAHLFLIILLISGIGLGVYLVGQRTNILPHASESGPIIFSPSPSDISSPISPKPIPIPCNPKKFNPKTWKVITIGKCLGGKQNIRYQCENKQKIDKVSCPKPPIPSSGGGGSSGN